MSGVEEKPADGSKKEAQEGSTADAIPFQVRESAGPLVDVELSHGRASTSRSVGRWQERHVAHFFPHWNPAFYPRVVNKLNDAEYPIGNGERGKCVIFIYNELCECTDADADVNQLSRQFTELGFAVIIYNNLSKERTLSELERLSQEDYHNDDCFVCWILTHGGSRFLCTSDGGILTVVTFISPFCENPWLRGKPKLFFIQSCSKDDFWAAPASSPRPPYDDLLVAHSDGLGFCRHNTAFWIKFAQAFCCALENSTGSEDLFTLLTEAYRLLHLCFDVNYPHCLTPPGAKPIPYVTSTLVRRVRLPKIRQA